MFYTYLVTWVIIIYLNKSKRSIFQCEFRVFVKIMYYNYKGMFDKIVLSRIES